jgi:hypothetical protein
VNRYQLEHVIRASGAITGCNDFIIVGSQAILGQFPNAPKACLRSIEADIYPRDDPEKADLIDGSIGEITMFHETFGYYAHGISPETASLPLGYQERLIPIRIENVTNLTGWCLEIHDLASSKLAAGREKDMDFVRTLLRENLVDLDTLDLRVKALERDQEIAIQRLGMLVMRKYNEMVKNADDRITLQKSNPSMVRLRDEAYSTMKRESVSSMFLRQQE